MAGHAYVNQIADPNARKALLDALGQITLLTNRIATLESTALLNTGLLNANNQRLTGLGTPIADSDAVPLSLLRQVVAAQVETFGI
jgi:hypothetical protein